VFNDRTELVRLLINAEADPTFIPTIGKGSRSSLALALDYCEESGYEAAKQACFSNHCVLVIGSHII
jgi:hypothetical protein